MRLNAQDLDLPPELEHPHCIDEPMVLRLWLDRIKRKYQGSLYYVFEVGRGDYRDAGRGRLHAHIVAHRDDHPEHIPRDTERCKAVYNLFGLLVYHQKERPWSIEAESSYRAALALNGRPLKVRNYLRSAKRVEHTRRLVGLEDPTGFVTTLRAINSTAEDTTRRAAQQMSRTAGSLRFWARHETERAVEALSSFAADLKQQLPQGEDPIVAAFNRLAEAGIGEWVTLPVSEPSPPPPPTTTPAPGPVAPVAGSSEPVRRPSPPFRERVTTREAAAWIGCSARHIRRLCREKVLRGAEQFARAGHWSIPAVSLQAFVQHRRRGAHVRFGVPEPPAL